MFFVIIFIVYLRNPVSEAFGINAGIIFSQKKKRKKRKLKRP